MSTVVLNVLDPSVSTSEFSKSALYSDRQIKLVRLVLPAGKQIPAHRAPGDLTVYCVEGKVDFVVGTESHELSTGNLIYVPDQQQHSLTALEGSILLLTIILRETA